MTQQLINIGTTADDGTGDPGRTAFDKVNTNFTELYDLAATLGDYLPLTGGTLTGDIVLEDNISTVYGTGQDSSIYEQGGYLVIDPDLQSAGSRYVRVGGALSVADWLHTVGALTTGSTADSTSTTTGALRSAGGIGVAKSAFIGGNIDITGTVDAGTYYKLGGANFLHNNGAASSVSLGLLTCDNVSALSCVFIGHAAGSSNTGLQCFGLGTESLNINTGANNVAIGFQAGKANTSGTENFFLGRSAGAVNSTGSYNVYLGDQAGKNGVNRSSNVCIGRLAGLNIAGNSNVLIGRQVGKAATSNNVMLGFEAGENSTGSNNVYLGLRAGESSSSGASNVFIGYTAGQTETGSNLLYIANTNTSTPLIHGDFSAAVLTINGDITVTGDVALGDAITDAIGLYGVTPVTQPTSLTGSDVNTPNSGDATTDAIIANLQTRVDELESKLQSLGAIA